MPGESASEVAAGYRQAAESLTQSALSRSEISRGLDVAGASRLAARLASLADKGIALLAAAGVAVECRPGCNYCCHREVFATPAECLRIFENVSAWHDEARAALRARLGIHEGIVARQREEVFVRATEPCPLLEHGLCSVYGARPLLCRGLSSVDARLCKALSENPSYQQHYGPNGERELTNSMREGTAKAFEQFGRPWASLELARTLRCLLDGDIAPADLLQRPATLFPPAERPWLVPPFRRTETEAKTGNENVAELLSALKMPRAFETAWEAEDAWRHFDQGLNAVQNSGPWDPAEAYRAVGGFRAVAFGNYPGSLVEPLKTIGRLFHERIAVPLAPDLVEALPRRRPGKIRVAFAGNIGDTNASAWSLGWLVNLDRSELETYVLKVGGIPDETTFRFKDAADHFYSLSGYPLEIARFIKGLDLDLLIYTDIGDNPCNYPLAIFRLARRQAVAWGCPITSGLPMIDDFLIGEAMEPDGGEVDYTERVVRLPNTGLTLPPFPPEFLDWSRERLGLPAGFLVTYPQFSWKWLPTDDHLLAQISQRIENPILMFAREADGDSQIVKRRLERAGVRATWRAAETLPIYRRIVHLCDVALDSPSWSGGVTAQHCLSRGIPIVHRPGAFLRRRLTAAFASTAGVPDLSVADDQAYVELATSPERLQATMGSLDASRLFDDLAPVRALEAHARQSVAQDL